MDLYIYIYIYRSMALSVQLIESKKIIRAKSDCLFAHAFSATDNEYCCASDASKPKGLFQHNY